MKISMMAGAVVLGLAASAAGAAPRDIDPDWPCQQAKVTSLSVASFWSGPSVDLSAATWQQDAPLAALVGIVTQRRLPMDQAAERISDFAKAAGANKNRELPELFAGVFDTLDHERAKVLSGLDRFGQRQKVLAADLRQDGEALRAAQASTSPDEAAVNALTQRLLWKQQVFQSRQESLRYACDVPTTIEQRLYGLSKAIQQLLE